jgi:hypothetical protein
MTFPQNVNTGHCKGKIAEKVGHKWLKHVVKKKV